MLLIFDCDGTLVDSELLHAQAEVDAINDIFGIKSDAASHNKRFVGGDDKQFYDWIMEQTGKSVPEDFSSELAKRKQSLFKNRLIPMPYVDETLGQLSRFQKCIASNTGPETLAMELKITGLFDRFEGNIFSATMVTHGKPAPDLFLYAAKKMQASAADCLVIEDSARGVAAARAANMRVFGFAGGSHCYQGYAQRLKDAELVFEDMRALPDLLQAL